MEGFAEGAFVSGGMDFNVVVWDAVGSSPSLKLQGHEQVITKVTHDAKGRIISGSQDKYESFPDHPSY